MQSSDTVPLCASAENTELYTLKGEFDATLHISIKPLKNKTDSMDLFQRAEEQVEQVGVNLGSQNNLDMNFVFQEDFWLLHPTSFVLVSLPYPCFLFIYFFARS